EGWYKDSTFTTTWSFATDPVTEATTLYAKWEAIPVFYDVTFESNGGSTVTAQSIEAGKFVVEPTAPTKAGFTFEGWYKDSSLTTVWNFATDPVTEATTLYAKWEVIPVFYDVIFESNGGSTVTAQSIESGKFVVEPTAPTKTGFTFEGWYKESTFTTAWNFTTDPVTEATTLYAKWEAIPVFYDVTFESNGGSTVNPQSIESGKFVVEPTAPTKAGFTFEGWYKESTFTTTWNFATDPVTEATTLYAKWEAIPVFYDVTFESNGGSTVTAQSVESGKFVVEPTEPTKAGFTFEGWYKDSTFTTAWNFATDPVTEATTLYAKWEAIPVFYDVTFESNGGSTVNPQSIESGKFVVEPTAPTKAGFTFEGWYKDSGFTTAWNFTTDTVTEATTLYAKWEAIPVFYDVTFESNGGTPVKTLSVKSGNPITEVINPMKEGYLFKGWYKDSLLTTPWIFEIDLVTESITLYAKWEAIPVAYDVTFESNGGTSVASQSIESGKFIVEPTAPTKAGFTFKGWYKDSAFTTEWDFTKDTVTEPITLYAKWEKDTILPPTGISYTNSVMIGLTMVGLGFVIIGYRKKEKLSKS
ncbi:InlB B-repeat-containing protein, partial [Erysipelothrix inopinata]